jgi:Zn-dependent protease
MLLGLIRLPIELALVAFHALIGVVDVIVGCKRRRFETTVLIKAPRDAVWRFLHADRIVLDGIPVMELTTEPVPGDDELHLERLTIAGREAMRVVARVVKVDATEGVSLLQIVPHELAHPPVQGTDHYAGSAIKEVDGGTAYTLHHEVTFGSFAQRVKLPLGVRNIAVRIKRQCEKEAGTHSRLAELSNHWLVLTSAALLSFWYLLGWQDALLIAVIIALHELGHAAAMWMLGIPVQGIYLIPFFGGAAVPRAAYRTQGQLGFVALMGAGFSLIPTLALALIHYATGDPWVLRAALMFALINGLNLLPVYPLDGGLILNALLGSLSRRLARAASWAGVVIGLGLAVYLQSLLIGIPIALFALCLFLNSGWHMEIDRLSAPGAAALVLAFAATFAIHLAAFLYADSAWSTAVGRESLWAGLFSDPERDEALADGFKPAVAEAEASARAQIASLESARKRAQTRLWSPARCDLPAGSAEVLDRLLSERRELDSEAANLVFGAPETTVDASLVSWTRILAWADRASHGDIVKRWLDSPSGVREAPPLTFAGGMRLGHWLGLAKSAPLAAIEKEIAVQRSADANGYDTLRHIFTTALIVYGRYLEAVALVPPVNEPFYRPPWLLRTLQDLVSAGAISEALWLMERNRADAEHLGPWGHSMHLLGLAATLQRVPAALGDYKVLVEALTDELRGLQQADRAKAVPDCFSVTCTKEQYLQHIKRAMRNPVSEIEALARFGQADLDLPEELLKAYYRAWYVRAVVAAARAERGDADNAEGLRDLVTKLPAAPEYPQTPVGDLFDIVYAAIRVSLSLGRGDIEKANALAEATAQRSGVPLSIRALMIDHYLWVGDWQRAEAWSKREILLGPGTSEGYPDALCRPIGDLRVRELCNGYPDPVIRHYDPRPWYERPEEVARLRTRVQMTYHLKLAAAAAAKGEGVLASTALERARLIACERAAGSSEMRHDWWRFLRRAYLVKAVLEGRLPGDTLRRPS